MKLLYNANIYTLDKSQPKVSAILIAGGRVIAVGDKDKLESLAHGKVEKQDMQGKTILPGLTDAHLHIQYFSLGLAKIDCETKTKAECLRRVAERVKKAKPGEWILGHGWNHNEWLPSPLGRGAGGEGELPTADDLDALAPNNPVYLTAKSLHAAWANTSALNLARITSDTPNPKDGVIQRDHAGRATGALLEIGNVTGGQMSFPNHPLPKLQMRLKMRSLFYGKWG